MADSRQSLWLKKVTLVHLESHFCSPGSQGHMKIFTPTFRDKECCPEPCKLQKQSLTIASCFSYQGAEEATHSFQGMSPAKVSQEADCYLNILDS